MQFQLSSPAFNNNTPIPLRHSCDGQNVSPALSWAGAPDNTKSFALTVDDPDAPGGTHHHWAIYNIPVSANHLDEGFAPPGATAYVQAHNDSGKIGYSGPCPPPGHGLHHYHFRLFALDIPELNLPDQTQPEAVEKAILPHILNTAEIIGTYERKK